MFKQKTKKYYWYMDMDNETIIGYAKVDENWSAIIDGKPNGKTSQEELSKISKSMGYKLKLEE